jgi:hypothetical protein
VFLEGESLIMLQLQTAKKGGKIYLFPEEITIDSGPQIKYYHNWCDVIYFSVISRDNQETCLFHSLKLNFHLKCSQATVGDMKPNQSGVVMTSSEDGAIENLLQTQLSSYDEPPIQRILTEPPRSQASHQILFQMKWINAS